MINETCSLAEVFDLIKTDDRKAGVELLYKYHYNKLYSIAFSFTKDKSDSEDIVEEVFLKLLTMRKELLPKSNCSSWLYVLVKNQTMTYLKKGRDLTNAKSIDSLPNLIDRSSENFDAQKYYDMIRDLSKEQQRIVTLKVLGGYTHKEIAKMLKKPVGTVQWLYNVSIKKLKALKNILLSVFLCISAVMSALSVVAIKVTTEPSDGIYDTILKLPIQLFIVIVIGWSFAVLSGILSCFLIKYAKMPTKHGS